MKLIKTIAFFLGFVACQETVKNDQYSTSADKISELEVKESNLSEEQSSRILSGYLKIKDGLVNSNSNEAAFAAENLLFDFEENDNQVVEKLFHEVNLIANSKDLEQQRLYFEALSHNMYTLLTINRGNLAIYQQYCPMAFDNRGAYWISDEENIYNPYFGDKMLRCGKVTEVIEKTQYQNNHYN